MQPYSPEELAALRGDIALTPDVMTNFDPIRVVSATRLLETVDWLVGLLIDQDDNRGLIYCSKCKRYDKHADDCELEAALRLGEEKKG
jgi:hypothetical protein